VPDLIVWPSSMKKAHQDFLTAEIQRLMNLLKMKTGIYNIESCVSGGKPYIMEISPRGGGCKIAELQKMAFGVDLIDAEIRSATGLPVKNVHQTECKGFWCEKVIHAKSGESGILKEIVIDPEIREKYVRLVDIPAKKGSFVKPFTGANMALGNMFLRFESRSELDEVMSEFNDWLRIILEPVHGGGALRYRRILSLLHSSGRRRAS
jgi:hypothetical protein